MTNLLQYGTVKRFENFFKGFSYDKTQISPVPPADYGSRFYKFITGITKSAEEVERQKHSMDRHNSNSSIDKTMQKAEKQAAKEQHPGHPRTLSTVYTPAENGEPVPSTLPIVEEAGEGSSTGEHSQHGENWPLPGPEESPRHRSSNDHSRKGKERDGSVL